jgi:hypothetical protein
VPLRDDRDALLARAEALSREAERLRRDNEALRAEAVSEAERLRRDNEALRAEAARRAGDDASRRAPVERLAARARPATPAEATRDPGRDAANRIEHALAGSSALGALLELVIVLLGLVAAALGVVTIVDGFLAELLVLPLILLLVLVLGPVAARWGSWRRRRAAARERRRLGALGFPLDVAGYLAYLAEPEWRRVVRVRVAFVAPPGDQDRALIERAVRGGYGAAEPSWEGAILSIASPALHTGRFGRSGGEIYDNTAVHRWFRRLTRRVLSPLTAAFPVARVTVS